MGNHSIQNPIPEGGSGQTPPQEKAKDESADSQHNDMPAPNGDGGFKPKPIFISALLFAGCEALGYICTEIADGLEGYIAMVVHWIALCCSAAGFFAAWHEMVEGKKASRIWTAYGFVCILLALIAYLVWCPEPPAPPQKLHLTLYAHTADSPDDILDFTNNILVVETAKEGFTFPPNLPFLVVDVAQHEPQFTLNLGIFNDSAPRFSPSKFDAVKPEIMVWIADPDPGETLNWTEDPKWEKASSNGTMTNGVKIKFQGRVLRYQFPDPLASGTGDSAPGIRFNMQEKPSGLTVAVLVGGENVAPVVYCFKLLAIPSGESASKIRFDTNNVIWWNWKYRPVAYRPIDTPLLISPSRVQLSDGKNTFGKEVIVSNPSSSNLYAITLGVEIESNAVPIGSPLIELSQPKQHESSGDGELQIPFEVHFDFIGYSQDRVFVIPELPANEARTFWIRGTILTNSFAVVSVWQSMNSFPDVKYMTNGFWIWPVFSTNSAWWIHSGGQPMDFGIGIMAWRGNATNGFTNDSQIIPSRP
jgi:hypothetical protein